MAAACGVGGVGENLVGEVASGIVVADRCTHGLGSAARSQGPVRSLKLRADRAAEDYGQQILAGFDADRSYPGHLGLQSMRERMAGVGGALQIQSSPGQGTSVETRLPLPAIVEHPLHSH